MAVPTSPALRRVRAWPRWLLISVLGLIGLLIVGRLVLPAVVHRLINQRLAGIPGYTGYVNDVDLHLWRGAYSLHGVGILRENEGVREPFFLARHIDFSLAWRELWQRKIVSDIRIDRGQLNFVHGPTEASSQVDVDRRWQEVIQDIFPIDITRLEITDGLLRYVNTTREPTVNLFVTHMQATATGLRNRPGEASAGEFPAKIVVRGESLGGGKLHLELNAEPLAKEPHFHLSLQLEEVDLTALNPSLKAYANVDVSRGTFRLVGEMAGRDGGFQGYVKPFFENLDFQNIQDREKGPGALLWERLVAAFAWVVKDKSRDQVATRIPFSGKFGDAQVGLLSTIANLFRHGFVRAFNPTVEGSVDPDKVRADGTSTEGPTPQAPRQP